MAGYAYSYEIKVGDMKLKEQLQQDLQEAMRDGDERSRLVLRLLLAEINGKEIELKKKEEGLSDEQIGAVVLKEIKKRADAAQQYRQGNREELAAAEEQEAEILKRYAPQQLSEEAVAKLVEEAVATTGASGPADIGAVMKEVMARAHGQADGAAVSELVKKHLTS
jgi:uncharacterized protein